MSVIYEGFLSLFQDRLGLKKLDEAEKIQFLEVEGDHLEFDDEWFLTEIVDVYLT